MQIVIVTASGDDAVLGPALRAGALGVLGPERDDARDVRWQALDERPPPSGRTPAAARSPPSVWVLRDYLVDHGEQGLTVIRAPTTDGLTELALEMREARYGGVGAGVAGPQHTGRRLADASSWASSGERRSRP